MSNLKAWDNHIRQVLVDVPGCEWDAAELALKQAAREFFQITDAWREVCDPVNLQKGIADYNVLDVRDTIVIGVRDVFVNGTLLPDEDSYLTPDAFRRLRLQDDREGMPNKVSYFDDLLWMHPKPQQSGLSLSVTLVLQPTYESRGLPPEVFDRFIDTIGIGAIAILKNSQKKPYTDPDGFKLARAQFKQECGKWQIWAETGGVPKTLRTTPFYF